MKLLLTLWALASTSAFAQAPLGTVTNVSGLATVTRGATSVPVVPGTAIQNGTRFLTTTSGSVTMSLNSGCTVTLPPTHAVTVLDTMTCQQLQAAIQPVTSVAAPGAATGPAVVVNGVIAAGAVGIVAAGVEATTNDDNVVSGR